MKDKLIALWKDKDNQYHYTKWLFQYSKPYLWKIILIMLINLGTTGLTLVMTLITKRIIDNATGGVSENLLLLIGVYFALTILTQIIGIVVSLFSTMLNEKFSFGIRKQIYDKIMRSHWIDVKKYHTGDLMTRLTSDAGSVADGIVGTIPDIIRLFVELIMVFFTLLYFSPLIAVFALLIAPVAALTSWLLGKKLKKLQVKVQETESAYRSFLQESLANLLIVKSFCNEDYSIDRLTELREDRFFWVLKRTKMGLASSTAMSLSFQIGYIVAFAYGAMQVASKVITYGTMSVFLTLVNRVQVPIMMLAQQIPKVVAVLASAGRIIEIQNVPEEEFAKDHIAADNVGLSIKDVTFGYDKETVIENASCEIQPHEFVAIIGESGIGKTTLIRLIMSFMSQYQGDIEFFNQNGERERANAGMRNYIAYVPQGNTLFSGTIRENIRMGKLDATEDEMTEALKLASGFEFVMDLPNGIDTVIGERGHGISEGQAQRIAIARALIRKAP
ncbi:MAG TPA: ABC transporter ATP-binding protein, partial [Lachnospiraceae bacterium]|nr:ABC transporter ATP-binding protein [Lachnospiraceae bacterium]